jgi:hypothetical protein
VELEAESSVRLPELGWLHFGALRFLPLRS